MKKQLLFLPLMATLAFAGCSNDDLAQTGGGKQNNDGCGYVAVNIVQPKSVGSRAVGTTGFQDGTEEENFAEDGLFFIFNADGTRQYGQPQIIPLSGSGTLDTPEVERIYSAVLVIENAGSDPSASDPNAYQIVCILNAPESLTYDSNTTLDDLKQAIDNYDAHENGTFIMTNSVYRYGNNDRLGAIIKSENIKRTSAEAINSPVDIYVERVVAKVQAKSSSFKNNGATVSINGEEKNLTIKVTGIEIANIATKSYLFKNIDNITEAWMWDPANRRSYWENIPDNLVYTNKSYDAIASNPDFSIDDVNLAEYIQPNTNANQKTSVLVTAELLDDGKPADIVYFGGQYYTQSSVLNNIAQFVKNYNYCKKVGDTFTSFVPDDFEWINKKDNSELTWLKSYEVVARLKQKNTYDVYQKNGAEYEPVADGTTVVNKMLAGDSEKGAPYKARVFDKGKCYYFVDIDHTPVYNSQLTSAQEQEHFKDGVVRNHIYDLTLSSIQGIGVPVFHPDEEIIPEKPDDSLSYFLAARINVLAWKVVTQDVNFEFK